MRIPFGNTTTKVAFVAVDATDKVTRETGLASFTVYRSRNGGTATAFTTPTVAELSAANMPGVYVLTIDEDMAQGSLDTEEMVLHITHAGMDPVTRVIELYRPVVTAGQTLTVGGGVADVSITQINGDAVAAGAMEAFFDGVWYGTAESGTTTTLVDTNTTQSNTDHFKGALLVLRSGTMSRMSREITAFDPATDTFTFYPPLPSGVTTENFAIIPKALVEAAYTEGQIERLVASAMAGKVSGMAAGSPVFRDVSDTKNRISATTDADGNRSAVTLVSD